jgi:competence protein ComEA
MKAKVLLVSLALTSASALAADKAMPVPAVPAAPPAQGMMDSAKGAAMKAGEGVMVNLNTATETDLQKVPGLTPAHAKEIISHRPYKSVSELSKVKGIKQDMIAKIKPYLTVK